MEAKKSTMMGKLLSRVHNARHYSRLDAINELWKRNKLDNPMHRDGYKLAETQILHRDGMEVTEYRLYKLIDSTVVTVSAEVNTKIEVGLEALRENQK